MKREPDDEWISRRLRHLTRHAEEIQEAGTEQNMFQPWTILKELVMVAAVDVYSTVASNNFEDMYYIDALAGSGSVKIEGRDEVLVGSPILAGTMAHEPFSKMFLIESDEDAAESLRSRLDYAAKHIDEFDIPRDDCEVIHADANEVLPDIPAEIRSMRETGHKGANFLAFIDNEGSEIDWKAIRELSDIWGDLLINHQTTSIDRTLGRMKSGDATEQEAESVMQYLSMEDPEGLLKISQDERTQKYLDNFADIELNCTESITINGNGKSSYNYEMIYATRKENSPWVDFMVNMRPRIESLDGDDVETVLKLVQGTQTNLRIFESEDDNQAKLADF